MADRYGSLEPLHVIADRLTDREIRVRLEWIQMQWNEPSRSDHYVMQVCQTVQQLFAKDPNSILLDNFRIPFTFKTPESEAEKKEKEAKTALAVAKAALGKFFRKMGGKNKDQS